MEQNIIFRPKTNSKKFCSLTCFDVSKLGLIARSAGDELPAIRAIYPIWHNGELTGITHLFPVFLADSVQEWLAHAGIVYQIS